MAVRLSRRVIANYVAERLTSGDKQIITQLAAFLVSERRTQEVDLLVRDIETALASSGLVISDVVTARPLNEKLRSTIESYIKSSTNAKSVTLRERVDATELGGVKISLPGAEYDATLRGRLAKLKRMKV